MLWITVSVKFRLGRESYKPVAASNTVNRTFPLTHCDSTTQEILQKCWNTKKQKTTRMIGWCSEHICKSHYNRRRAGRIPLNLVAKLMEFLYVFKLTQQWKKKTIYLTDELLNRVCLTDCPTVCWHLRFSSIVLKHDLGKPGREEIFQKQASHESTAPTCITDRQTNSLLSRTKF